MNGQSLGQQGQRDCRLFVANLVVALQVQFCCFLNGHILVGLEFTISEKCVITSAHWEEVWQRQHVGGKILRPYN